jgi:hypothetical protein
MTMPYPSSKASFSRPLMTAAALAVGLGVFASFAPASAAPMQASSGLTNPGLEVEDAGYRRAKKNREYYVYQYGVPERSERYMPFGGSDEIRELQRYWPYTNWPRSMRYFY